MSDEPKRKYRDSIFADKRITELQGVRKSVALYYAVFSSETADVILRHIDDAQRAFEALKAAEGAVYRAGMAIHEAEKVVIDDQLKPAFQQNTLPVTLRMALSNIQRAIDR